MITNEHGIKAELVDEKLVLSDESGNSLALDNERYSSSIKIDSLNYENGVFIGVCHYSKLAMDSVVKDQVATSFHNLESDSFKNLVTKGDIGPKGLQYKHVSVVLDEAKSPDEPSSYAVRRNDHFWHLYLNQSQFEQVKFACSLAKPFDLSVEFEPENFSESERSALDLGRFVSGFSWDDQITNRMLTAYNLHNSSTYTVISFQQQYQLTAYSIADFNLSIKDVLPFSEPLRSPSFIKRFDKWDLIAWGGILIAIIAMAA